MTRKTPEERETRMATAMEPAGQEQPGRLSGLAGELLGMVGQPVLPRGREITRQAWERNVRGLLARVYSLGMDAGWVKATGTPDLSGPGRLRQVLSDPDVHRCLCAYVVDPDGPTLDEVAARVAEAHASLPGII
jgi:hypothetical protein